MLEPRAEHLRLRSAASWPAIIAGAFVAAAVSLVLLALGSGLGFAAISPWPGHGVAATTFAVTTLHMGTPIAFGATVVLGLCNFIFALGRYGGRFGPAFGRCRNERWARLIVAGELHPDGILFRG